MTKTCKICGVIKPVSDFRHNRLKCITCETNTDRMRRRTFGKSQYSFEPIPNIHSFKRIPVIRSPFRTARQHYRNLPLRTCGRCGLQFRDVRNYQYCSERCCNKEYRQHRRVFKRSIKNGYVERIRRHVLFSAYNWQCAICGCETPPYLMGKTLDNAPTIDHIIPISRGGKHTRNNVQLACFKCNVLKSNKICV